MNTRDIARLLTSDSVVGARFRGVFARDEFLHDFSLSPQGVRVFNTHNSRKSGAHWIAVCGDGTQVAFFDSFGRHPDVFPDVFAALGRAYDRIAWNDTILQHVLSNTCGDYCVLFCLLWSRGWSVQRFVERFLAIADSHERDHAVRDVLLDVYGRDSIEAIHSDNPPLGSRLEGLDGVHVEGTGKILVRMVSFIYIG